MASEQEVPVEKPERINLIWVGVAFGAIYWVLESVRDVLAFHKGTLAERLFFPDLPSIWTRLVIIAMIVFYGLYAQSLRSGTKSGGSRQSGRIILSGFVFALAYWILESARDAFMFKQGRLLDQLVRPDIPDVSVRLLAVCMLVLFSVYVQNLINERRVAEESMRRSREELEKLVTERTTELAASNDKLRQEVDGRKRLEAALWISRRSFHDIVNATYDGILVLDSRSKVRFANAAAGSLLERRLKEVVGEDFQLPVQAGQVRRVTLPRGRGDLPVEMKVLETEWQGEQALLVLLHAEPQPLGKPVFR